MKIRPRLQNDALLQVEKSLRDDPNLIHARGAVGETILHLCFLYNKPAHLTIARNIINRFPQAITATYEGEDYLGALSFNASFSMLASFFFLSLL